MLHFCRGTVFKFAKNKHATRSFRQLLSQHLNVLHVNRNFAHIATLIAIF